MYLHLALLSPESQKTFFCSIKYLGSTLRRSSIKFLMLQEKIIQGPLIVHDFLSVVCNAFYAHVILPAKTVTDSLPNYDLSFGLGCSFPSCLPVVPFCFINDEDKTNVYINVYFTALKHWCYCHCCCKKPVTRN